MIISLITILYLIQLLGHEDGGILLQWPLTIVHPIDRYSPLYRISADQLQNEVFEIVVTLEATTGSTNMDTQTVTSYIPSEILWGYRFAEMFTIDPASKHIIVNEELLNSVHQVEAPMCSGADYEHQFNQKTTWAD